MKRTLCIGLEPGWDAWRAAARACLGAALSPDEVQWVAPGSLFAVDPLPKSQGPTASVPRAFMQLARRVAHHRDEARAALLYRVLWRLSHGEPHLLSIASDPDVAALGRLDAAVRRSAHKTKAFVRFRRTEGPEGEHYVAWHQPEHPVLPLLGTFFAERFSDMRWSILTPDASLHYDGSTWSLGPGAPRSAAPSHDELETLWRTYYRAIFNPARVMVKAMTAEMPKRHWSTLPETREIPSLLAEAGHRVEAMLRDPDTAREQFPPADPLVASAGDLADLSRQLDRCRACELHGPATQAVAGTGPADARIVLVGEQPGDLEDRSGRPFVGPAGEVLDACLQAAGLDREQLFLTNAVKHFHFAPQGKRRLHSRPRPGHVRACRPWLLAELERIRPAVVVCLGSTAARTLLGAEIRVLRDRGHVHTCAWAPAVVVTVHPSSVLRTPDPTQAEALRGHLIDDLRLAARIWHSACVGTPEE